MEARQAVINSAAHELRVAIDTIWANIVDEQHSTDIADAETKDLYDAVTLLHEFASEKR